MLDHPDHDHDRLPILTLLPDPLHRLFLDLQRARGRRERRRNANQRRCSDERRHAGQRWHAGQRRQGEPGGRARGRRSFGRDPCGRRGRQPGQGRYERRRIDRRGRGRAIDGTRAIFRSDDAGQSWSKITDDKHQFATIQALTGDPRVYGRVYVGTNGLGILYGDLVKDGAK